MYGISGSSQQLGKSPQQDTQPDPPTKNQITVTSGSNVGTNFDQYVRGLKPEVYLNRDAGFFLVEVPGVKIEQQGNIEDEGGRATSMGFDPETALLHNFFWGKLQDGKAYQLNNEFVTSDMSDFLDNHPEVEEGLVTIPFGLRAATDPRVLSGIFTRSVLDNGGPNFFTGGVSLTKAEGGMIVRDKDSDQSSFQKLVIAEAEKILGQIKFEPVPRIQRPTELGILPDGRYIAVDIPATDYLIDEGDPSNGYRMLIGEPGKMKEMKIKSFEITEEGGLPKVQFKSDEGTLTIRPSEVSDAAELTFQPLDGDPQELKEIPILNPNTAAKPLLDSLGVKSWNVTVPVPDLPSSP